MLININEALQFIFRKIYEFICSEYFLWTLMGCLVSARVLVNLLSGYDFLWLIEYHFGEMLLSVLIVLFPVVYYQIFGESPFEAIRKKIKDDKEKNIVIHGSGNIIHLNENNKLSGKVHVHDNEEHSKNVTQLLGDLAKNSEYLANKIYTRSNVYLIFGCLIAFCGILYFSFQGIGIAKEDNLVQVLSLLAPRLGIFFFIEFIAFFFLKQYRAAMDEFRYYDAHKRNRESQLVIYLLASKDFPEKNFQTVLDKMRFFQPIGKLLSGESTEFLESNKMNKNEFEILKELIVNLVNQKKSSDNVNK